MSEIFVTRVVTSTGGQQQAERHGNVVAVTDGDGKWLSFPEGVPARVIFL